MAWKRYNPNPYGNRVGDCTVRAISAATEQTWERTYMALCLEGFCMGDMPSANQVWSQYLRSKGFKRRVIGEECPTCYTVADFAQDHPHGLYVLALDGHVLCVKDGDYHDTWDSGGEIPVYYWTREER